MTCISLSYFVIAFRVRITGNLLFVCYFGRKRFCIYSKARVEIGFLVFWLFKICFIHLDYVRFK
jgi:hypothetical protein